jgi:hypothetical protein
VKRRPLPLLPRIYDALFDLSLMRDEVRRLGGKIAERDTLRFNSHFDLLEAKALRLVDEFESRHRVVAH